MKRCVDNNIHFNKRIKINYQSEPNIHNFKNVNDYIMKDVAYNYGTKIGLIIGSKMLKNIKNFGSEYLQKFIEKEYKENIFGLIQDIKISSKFCHSNFLKNNHSLFFKYFDNFTNGFLFTFRKYLFSNLKDYTNILMYLETI